MDTQLIIDKYYKKGTKSYNIFMSHATDVANKALSIVHKHPELAVDVQFIEEAAMLHDIGIFKTHAPHIGCYGKYPYICHGYLGNELMISEGYQMCIRDREDELGVKIFDRTQLPVQPTEIGVQIISQARIALAQINRIKEIIQEEKGIVKGTFHLGIIPTVSTYLLPRLMRVHQHHRFDIKIVVNELTTNQILHQVLKGTLDGAILATPLNEEHISERPLYYEKFYAYVSPKEKPLYAKTALNENDLNTTRLWLLDEVHCFRTQILHLCNMRKKRKNHPIFSYEAGSIDTLINLSLIHI